MGVRRPRSWPLHTRYKRWAYLDFFTALPDNPGPSHLLPISDSDRAGLHLRQIISLISSSVLSIQVIKHVFLSQHDCIFCIPLQRSTYRCESIATVSSIFQLSKFDDGMIMIWRAPRQFGIRWQHWKSWRCWHCPIGSSPHGAYYHLSGQWHIFDHDIEHLLYSDKSAKLSVWLPVIKVQPCSSALRKWWKVCQLRDPQRRPPRPTRVDITLNHDTSD